jgi:hypothetical protein
MCPSGRGIAISPNINSATVRVFMYKVPYIHREFI